MELGREVKIRPRGSLGRIRVVSKPTIRAFGAIPIIQDKDVVPPRHPFLFSKSLLGGRRTGTHAPILWSPKDPPRRARRGW